MSNTKIVLNRQSDLILDNAQITSPTGIILADISGAVEANNSLQAQIDFITSNVDPAAIDSLTEIVSAFQSADGNLNGAITALADAATTDLSAEESRATSVEAVLSTDLSVETSRATSVEAVLSTNLSVETSRATSVEAVLSADLSVETSNRISISAVHLARTISAEDSIVALISDSNSSNTSSVSVEASLRIDADISLDSKINARYQDRVSADASLEVALSSQISTEHSHHVSAEASLASDLADETEARIAAVSVEASSRISGDASLTSALSTEVVDRTAAVSAEASSRVSGDASLQAQIDFITSNVNPAAIDSLTEIVSAFQSADGDLNGAISSLATAATTSLTAEASLRASADASLEVVLSTEISTEHSHHVSAELSLTEALSTEASNRISISAVHLARTISAEDSIVALISDSNSSNTSSVSVEASLRIDADISLDSKINARYQDRVSADASLDYALSAEISDRVVDVNAEQSRAQSVEAVLSSDLSTSVDNEASIRAAADIILDKEIGFVSDLGAYANEPMMPPGFMNISSGREFSIIRNAYSRFQSRFNDYFENNKANPGYTEYSVWTIDGVDYPNFEEMFWGSGIYNILSSGVFNNLIPLSQEELATLSTALSNNLIPQLNLTQATGVDDGYGNDVMVDFYPVISQLLSEAISDGLQDQFESMLSRISNGQFIGDPLSILEAGGLGMTYWDSTENVMKYNNIFQTWMDYVNIFDYQDSNSDYHSIIQKLFNFFRKCYGLLTIPMVTDLKGWSDKFFDHSGWNNVDGTYTNPGTLIGLQKFVDHFKSGFDILRKEKDTATALFSESSLEAALSSEISRAEAAEESLEVALSTEVSYLLSNTDLTSIDSFAEVSTALATQVSDFESIYFKKAAFTGAINGTNEEFTLSSSVRSGSETVYLNGLLQEAGVDYTVSGDVITFTLTPQVGDKVVVYAVY